MTDQRQLCDRIVKPAVVPKAVVPSVSEEQSKARKPVVPSVSEEQSKARKAVVPSVSEEQSKARKPVVPKEQSEKSCSPDVTSDIKSRAGLLLKAL